MRAAAIIMVLSLACAAAEIPQGAHVALRLVNSVSTRTARDGDYVYMTTASPIAAGGRMVVPVGSYVQGIVTRSVRSGRVRGRAELSLRIESLTLPGGSVVQMSPRLRAVDSEGTEQKVDLQENGVQQGGTKGADAARIVTLSGAGAALGGLTDRGWRGAGIGAGAGAGVGIASVLLTRGREVDLRQGTIIDVVFEKAVAVE